MATIDVNMAEAHVASVFRAHNCAPFVADRVARALTQAQVDGQSGHGYARVAIYAAQSASGRVDGYATPTAHWPKEAFAVVHAHHGFAFPALDLAIETLAECVPRTGIAACVVRHSNHAGVLGHTVEALAKTGFVALMMATTPVAMAPWGGSKGLYGTNPIGFAAPNGAAPPVVVDLSLSEVARGKIMAASKTGAALPQGWALDAQGNPTTEPQAALAGTMLPAGGAKGAALALMVEVLAGALAGPALSREATSFFAPDGAPSDVGQFLMAIDPNAGHDRGAARILDILQEIEAQEGARLPGSKRLLGRAKALETGCLDVPDAIWAEIEALPTA